MSKNLSIHKLLKDTKYYKHSQLRNKNYYKRLRWPPSSMSILTCMFLSICTNIGKTDEWERKIDRDRDKDNESRRGVLSVLCYSTELWEQDLKSGESSNSFMENHIKAFGNVCGHRLITTT